MYRNVFYDRKKSMIHHWGYDEHGVPVKYEVPFSPYLYVEALNKNRIDCYGIDGVPLEKKTFNNEWDRRKYADKMKEKMYFNLPPTQQYLLEKYHDLDIQELTKRPLRTFFFDIEVIADEFPDANEAKFPINAITIWDSLYKKYHVWGTEKYDPNTIESDLKEIGKDEIIYSYCKDERDLLKKFVAFWRANFPDVISGYNSYSFDMPYIVHRIQSLFGKGKEALLSPIKNVYGVEKTNKFAQKYIEYTIGGISHIDYMVLYKTFTPGERESDSLDFICWEEIGRGKLDYGDMSLKELKDSNWNKFVNYNIWDVFLMVKLDEKRRYLDIAKFSAFSGFCNLDKAFGKTSIITGVLAKQSMQKNQMIPTQSEGVKESIPGGYVKQPNPGLYENVTSFDANSLYPSCMITLNISPETKVAKVISTDDFGNIHIRILKDDTKITVPKIHLKEFLVKKNWSMSASGVFFDQSYKGVSAEFVDGLYQKRKEVKERMYQIQNQMNALSPNDPEYKKLKFTSSQLDTEQYLYKILLNSTYGAFANRFFSLYDIDCAKAITTTGQAMIKATEKFANDYISTKYGLDIKDRVVGMDTDSCMITILDVCDKLGVQLTDKNGDLTPEFIQIETDISNHLNKSIKQWAIDKLNSKDPRFFFKRESVSPKAIWTGKKHYILYIVNKEGEKMDKFKYSGLSIAKSTWSNTVKDISKDIIKIIMLHKDQPTADSLINEAFEHFKTLDVNEVAERGSIKVLNKWDTKNKEFDTATGTTRNAKYCIWHNELLKSLDLNNKYRKIENGSKIKIVAIKDNMYNLPGIAYQDLLPSDFNFKVDYEGMFYKGIMKCLEPIYISMGWELPDPKKQYENTVEDLFG